MTKSQMSYDNFDRLLSSLCFCVRKINFAYLRLSRRLVCSCSMKFHILISIVMKHGTFGYFIIIISHQRNCSFAAR